MEEFAYWRFDACDNEPFDSTIRSQLFNITQATERHGDNATQDNVQFDAV
jgi:hypothetical protein